MQKILKLIFILVFNSIDLPKKKKSVFLRGFFLTFSVLAIFGENDKNEEEVTIYSQ